MREKNRDGKQVIIDETAFLSLPLRIAYQSVSHEGLCGKGNLH